MIADLPVAKCSDNIALAIMSYILSNLLPHRKVVAITTLYVNTVTGIELFPIAC